MLWLVEPDLSAPRQSDRSQTTPAFFFYRAALHLLTLQRLHRSLQVVAHEVQLVQVVLLGGMKRSLSRWQRKNQPAMPRLHCRKLKNVAKESAVAVRILAINDDVSSVDHRPSLSPR